jgi:hypothetical protein
VIYERIEYFETLARKPWLRRRWYWSWIVGDKVIADGAEDYVSESNVKRAIQANINSKMQTPVPVVRRA